MAENGIEAGGRQQGLTVLELIKLLQTFPSTLPVAFPNGSEFVLLTADEVLVQEHVEPRDDNWVARRRPDKPATPYLIIGW